MRHGLAGCRSLKVRPSCGLLLAGVHHPRHSTAVTERHHRERTSHRYDHARIRRRFRRSRRHRHELGTPNARPRCEQLLQQFILLLLPQRFLNTQTAAAGDRSGAIPADAASPACRTGPQITVSCKRTGDPRAGCFGWPSPPDHRRAQRRRPNRRAPRRIPSRRRDTRSGRR